MACSSLMSTAPAWPRNVTLNCLQLSHVPSKSFGFLSNHAYCKRSCSACAADARASRTSLCITVTNMSSACSLSSADMITKSSRDSQRSSLLRYTVKTWQCDCIFCLEPEGCMCTFSQCVTSRQPSHCVVRCLSQQHNRRSHRTGRHTEQYPDVPVLTSRHTQRYPYRPTLASQIETHGIQPDAFSINTCATEKLMILSGPPSCTVIC